MIQKKLDRFLLIVVTASMLSPVPGATHGKRFRYLEQTGQKLDTCECLVRTDGKQIDLKVSYPDGVWSISADSAFSARSCEVSPQTGPEQVLFKRTGSKITCSRGSISKGLDAKPIPWFQTPFSLSGFITSAATRVTFTCATLYDAGKKKDDAGGSLITMVASKEKREPTKVHDSVYPSVKVVITLPGFKSLFWKITYWYRESDGMVLRYEDVRGGPGTPKTAGTLLKETIE